MNKIEEQIKKFLLIKQKLPTKEKDSISKFSGVTYYSFLSFFNKKKYNSTHKNLSNNMLNSNQNLTDKSLEQKQKEIKKLFPFVSQKPTEKNKSKTQQGKNQLNTGSDIQWSGYNPENSPKKEITLLDIENNNIGGKELTKILAKKEKKEKTVANEQENNKLLEAVDEEILEQNNNDNKHSSDSDLSFEEEDKDKNNVVNNEDEKLKYSENLELRNNESGMNEPNNFEIFDTTKINEQNNNPIDFFCEQNNISFDEKDRNADTLNKKNDVHEGLEKMKIEEEIKKEEKQLNESINKSRTNMMCNHCLYISKTYEEMKEHYKSEFHKYNLNRVTMNLAPLSYEDYKRKKDFFMKKLEEKKKTEEALKLQSQNLYCEICSKKFNSSKKLQEHLISKTHLKNKTKKNDEEISTKTEKNEINTENKNKEPEKTTLDDITYCLFCNTKSDTLKNNFYHMVQIHNLEIPFIFYIKNYEELIKILAKKIFVYHACFTCDTQKFESIRSLQRHMISKGHTIINNKDLDEFLYKYYDYKKLLNIKDKNKRKSKEFKILLLRIKVAKELKEKNLDGDEWEEINDDEDEDDFEPMTLPNGELLLQNGKTLGNKEFKIYYKQKFHINKYEELQKAHKERNKERKLRMKRRDQIRKNIKRNVNYKVLKGSNKGNFDRINKLTVMRPQIALV